MCKLSLSAVVAVLASTIAAPAMAQTWGDQSFAPVVRAASSAQCVTLKRGAEGGHDAMEPHPGGATAFFIPTSGPAERGHDALAEGKRDHLSSGTSFAEMTARPMIGRGHDALGPDDRSWSSPVEMASAAGVTAAC